MLSKNDSPELSALAEPQRDDLGLEFFGYRDYVEGQLMEGHWPSEQKFRGFHNAWSAKLSHAALAELRTLLCTSDERYAEVRTRGQDFTKAALPAVAGYVGAAAGVGIGLATAGVAFVALTILKVGLNTFCRAYEEPAGKSPTST